VLNDILEGLNFMHERSLFHNDITPRNIMLSEKTGGTAELIDMSHVSKYVGGSPSFDTSDLDERYQSNTTFIGMYNNSTDIFSVVALFYTMLTNRVPWDIHIPEGADRKERIRIVKEARKTPLNLDDLNIDEGYKRIIQKGLNVNGTCKYADAELLIADLQNPNRVNELEHPKESEQPSRQSGPANNVSDEEKQETEAKVEIQKGKGNGFKDIAGMNQLKQMLTQKVIFILKDKEKAARYKLLPPNGMLFYGPPGCGKSFFAEKFAEETGFNFMLVKASDLGSIYVHGSQGKIADLFKKAEENKPTIICFD
jgi:transitional endoplasmic reticulum ATPase